MWAVDFSLMVLPEPAHLTCPSAHHHILPGSNLASDLVVKVSLLPEQALSIPQSLGLQVTLGGLGVSGHACLPPRGPSTPVQRDQAEHDRGQEGTGLGGAPRVGVVEVPWPDKAGDPISG